MSDRFKFRVWNKGKSTWDKGFKMMQNGRSVEIKHGKSEDCFGVTAQTMTFYEAIEKTYIIQQCTGLKDKNGQLIYEGDILENWCGSEPVVWDNEFKIEHDSARFSVMHDDYKVIGNIFENPELLES